MKFRKFGPLDDQVPVVGQGTWNIGREEGATVIEAIRAGIDGGATHIDTAEMYGSGASEQIVGKAIDGRRDELFVVSKVLPSNATRRGTVEACRRSLDRLGIEHLDSYLLHWVGSHPLEQTIAGFEELQESGRIRSWGVSNFDENHLEKAIEIAGQGRIACNQVLYHLQERAIEHKVIPFCADNRIPVVAYSPFGSGDFPEAGSKGHAVLRDIGTELGATPHQVALAFLLRHENVFVIPRSTDPEHAAQNAAAGDLELSAEQIDRIDRAFPLGEWKGGVPVL